MTIAESWISEFDREMAETRRILERVPEDKLDWRPHAKSMTLGRLATHIAEIPGLAGAVAALPSLDISNMNFNRALKSRQELLETFDTTSSEARAAVLALKDSSVAETWTVTFHGQIVFSRSRSDAYRSFAMNHLVHHRGQLTVYLRLLDVPVPGLYGPSADEK